VLLICLSCTWKRGWNEPRQGDVIRTQMQVTVHSALTNIYEHR